MCSPDRRRFLKLSLRAAGGLGAGLVGLSQPAASEKPGERPPRRPRYLGWQVGLSYQAPRPEGRRPEELRRLIHEMREHGMNLLSIMLISYCYFDPGHDGFCWPVRRGGLSSFREENSLNAREETEFLGETIEQAREAGLHVQLMDNCTIWNPDRIVRGYPKTRPQLDWDGRSAGWVHCPDNPDAARCMRDEILDALDRYAARGVTSYALEWPGYRGDSCFCEHTCAAFAQETGRKLTPEWAKSHRDEFNRWKESHIGTVLRQLVDEVHRQAPKLEIWLHTACARGRGHAPQQLQKAGIAMTMPYMMHSPSADFRDVSRNLRAVSPLPAVGHVCVRSKPFKNYAIPPKDPGMIRRFFEHIQRTTAENLAGLVFFNESNVTPENRQAVYEGIARLAPGGLGSGIDCST